MGILECASGESIWRGYDYFRGGKVRTIAKLEEGVYKAAVSGSAASPYIVELNIDHPRKSTCSCPHANGRRIICKHIVAVYFALRPREAETFYREAMACEAEEEKRQEALAETVRRYILGLKKSELQRALAELLFDGPEWQYERFIRENGLDDAWDQRPARKPRKQPEARNAEAASVTAAVYLSSLAGASPLAPAFCAPYNDRIRRTRRGRGRCRNFPRWNRCARRWRGNLPGGGWTACA